MTEKTTNIEEENTEFGFKKLSIQISLNGLSFCILDTIGNKVLLSDSKTFKTQSTPYLLKKELKTLFQAHNVDRQKFSQVIVIHKNALFSLVPKVLFDKNELANYLKFNAKILANDHIVYDEIENHELVNVYVPFVNVNNYIFELFGAFEFKHSGTVLIETLLNLNTGNSNAVCYVYVSQRVFELVIIRNKKLEFYNQFEYKTKEDFLYYILFSFEQLGLDTETIDLKLFGSIEEGDEIYSICYDYVKNISVFAPSNSPYFVDEMSNKNIDFTILSSL